MIVTTPYNAKLEPLFGFVREGDYGRCKTWIESGNPVVNTEARGKSPLVEAAANGFFSILEVLLDCGDWKAYQEELDTALQQAVGTRHVSNVQILLDRGASPEEISWYDVFETHSHEITLAFLRHGKTAGDLGSSLFKLERGCIKAMAEFVPNRPDLQDPILREMAEALDDAQSYGRLAAEGREQTPFKEECERKTSHAKRRFWLLASTGVDVRRRFVNRWEDETTILEYTVQHGTLSQLKSLSPTEADWPAIAAAAKGMWCCDEGKMKFLLQCGFKLNDREDGTSSFMERSLTLRQLESFAVAAKAGGKLPTLSTYDWKRIRAELYEKSFGPWFLPLLAEQIPETRMEYLLDHEKCEEKFGRKSMEILSDLYQPETAMSPERFAALMKAEKAAHKGKRHRRPVQELLSLCRKAENVSAMQTHGFSGPEGGKYSIRSVSCSKDIWPWLFNFLDEFVDACETLGGKCDLKKTPAHYPPNTTEVVFRVTFLTLELPLCIKEPMRSAPLYWSKKAQPVPVPSGCLEMTYVRAGQNYPLGKETNFLEFKGKAPEMAEKLFKLAKCKKAEEDRAAQREREWAEQRKREAEERAKKEEERARRDAELAERRRREAEENAKRERALEAERRRKAEDDALFKRLVENATTVDQCRLARHFLEGIEARSTGRGGDSVVGEELMARLRRIVDEKESAAWSSLDCTQVNGIP